jgi:hypothetical protein
VSEEDWPSERPQRVGLISTKTDAFKAPSSNGLDAELRPIGPTQVAAAVALCERLDTQPAAAKVKAQVMDDFETRHSPILHMFSTHSSLPRSSPTSIPSCLHTRCLSR